MVSTLRFVTILAASCVLAGSTARAQVLDPPHRLHLAGLCDLAASSEAVSISDREAAEQILRTLDHAELEELGDLFQESSDAAVANIIEAFRSCGSSKSDEVPLLRKALYHKSDSARRRTFLVDLRPGEIIRVHEGNGEYLDDPGKFQRRGEKPIQIDGEVYLFLRKFGKWSPEPTLQSPATRNGTSRDV